MAEYGGTILWHVDDRVSGPIEPETLSLSRELLTSLHDWANRYDDTLNSDSPSESGFASKEEEERFEADGIRLWHSLQAELGGHWKVVYFSESQKTLLE